MTTDPSCSTPDTPANDAGQPLTSDELRRVDNLMVDVLRRHGAQSDMTLAWAASRGLLPSTRESWASGYLPPLLVDFRGLDRYGLEVSDMLRAGIVVRRRLKPHEKKVSTDPNSKHSQEDSTDRRPALNGFRYVHGGRVMYPLRDHTGLVRGWKSRIVHDLPLPEVAGDYDPEEADPWPQGAPKYLHGSKERSSRAAAGAKETEAYRLLLSPEFIGRIGPAIEAAAARTPKKIDDKSMVVVGEGDVDAMLASQAGASSIGLGGCETDSKQIEELIRLLREPARQHVPIYLCLDKDSSRWDRSKALEMGAGQRGMCALLAKIWSKDKTLARAIKVIDLPQPAEGGKVDLAGVLCEVYKSIPEPADTGDTVQDLLARGTWTSQVRAAQKVKLEELAAASVESIEYLISQIPDVVLPRNRSAALEETGLSAVAAYDPDLWAEIGPRVAEVLGVEKRDHKSWVKSVSKTAAEEAENAERTSADDPLARYTNKDGSIRPCWMSCLEILRKEFGTSMKWDEMSLTVVLETVTGNGKKIREKFNKKKFSAARSMLAKRYGCDVKKVDLEDAVGDLAIEQEIHPVQDWLRSLPKWDQEDHLPSLMTALGVTVERGYAAEKVALYTTYMRKTLIAAVARAMDPGCQVDTMLVLQGDQGIKKSSFFKALVPEIGWYGGAGRLDPEAKDSIMGLRKKWILEVAEVDRKSFFSSAAEWKDLITTQVDSLRPPYMRDVEDYPRTSIFMGSTNAEQFLTDPTGARRFWVVPLTLKKLKGEDIDKARIVKMREQLWAQAYAAYTGWVERLRPEAECPWWLDLEEERAHAVDIKRHKVEDLDQDRLRQYLNNELQSRTVLGIEICKACDWQPSRYGKKIKEWMQELGWTPSTNPTRDGMSYTAPADWRAGAGGLKIFTGGADPAKVIAGINEE